MHVKFLHQDNADNEILTVKHFIFHGMCGVYILVNKIIYNLITTIFVYEQYQPNNF